MIVYLTQFEIQKYQVKNDIDKMLIIIGTINIIYYYYISKFLRLPIIVFTVKNFAILTDTQMFSIR